MTPLAVVWFSLSLRERAGVRAQLAREDLNNMRSRPQQSPCALKAAPEYFPMPEFLAENLHALCGIEPLAALQAAGSLTFGRPRASACSLSPGLDSVGPLGRESGPGRFILSIFIPYSLVKPRKDAGNDKAPGARLPI